jgi:uncharacterized protein with GYD domain
MATQISTQSSPQFNMLLTLTAKGREDPAAASASLTAAGGVVSELGGTVTSLGLTYGQYDAVITGELPDTAAITSLAGWIQSQRFFATETLVGASQASFAAAPNIPHKG